MVYLFGFSPPVATSYSLFIIGVSSLLGAYTNYKKGLVNFKVAIFFGASSVTTVFITRKFLMPAIPEAIMRIGSLDISRSMLTMVLFALLMLIASVSMIRNKKTNSDVKECPDCIRFVKLFAYGVGIGLVTGLLGAGGGFLLIPALIILVKLPMKQAVGTSLLIIALNSLIGFAGDLGHFQMDWLFLWKISTFAGLGILAGGFLNKRVNGDRLKKGFGFFVLIMGVYIIFKELIFH